MKHYESLLTKWLTAILIAFSPIAYAKCENTSIKIAVIDTGFGHIGKGKGARLCEAGHQDFTSEQKFIDFKTSKVGVPYDSHGHGTNIVGVIESHLKKSKVKYCIVVLKYYEPLGYGSNNLQNTIKAFEKAIELKAEYINYSGGGETPYAKEKALVQKFLNNGGILVAAAGNDGVNLDLPRNGYYPATYDKRTVIVGMLDKDGKRSKNSNYGNIVTRWEVGQQVIGYGISMSGTSQATANATGKIASQHKNKCDIGK